MRILTWNINGMRTLPQYHPWNTLKSFDDILNKLEADILCFQEVKWSRSGLPRSMALPPSYNAFFSFPIRKTGYSGVVTYVRVSSTTPVKAEEGLSGTLPLPKASLPLSASSPVDEQQQQHQRVSGLTAYPPYVIPEEEDESELDFKDLDSEGRAVVLDFKLFVLINVYCPNDSSGSELRDKYKTDFHRMLEARVKGLIENEKRQVVVVGDLNACAAIIDHCEGHIMVKKGLAEGLQGEEGFWGKDVRRWLRDWLIHDGEEGGQLIDIARKLFPERKGMYTCWNTKISARETNYGTRIDYILITPGLLRWVKSADIQPEIKGSDHCPAYLDLHDQITDENGQMLHLSDAIGYDPKAEPPRLATKFWEEHSGRQASLDKFFGKKSDRALEAERSIDSVGEMSTDLSMTALEKPLEPPGNICSPSSPEIASPPSQSPPEAGPIASSAPSKQTSVSTTTAVKRKAASNPFTTVSQASPAVPKKRKQAPEKFSSLSQRKLVGYFTKPKTAPTKTPAASSSSQLKLSSSEIIDLSEDATEVDPDVYDDDYQLALKLSQEEQEVGRSGSSEASKQAWTSLLAPTITPNCTGHNEPAKELTVNKPGPNKGKRFFICSRPVGPGYDKGRAERLREHVDPQYKCDFFKWSSDVRRQMRKSTNGNGNGC